MTKVKEFYSVFEKSVAGILILALFAVIFSIDIVTQGRIIVMQLYGISVILAALFFGPSGVFYASITATVLILAGLYNHSGNNMLASITSFGMFGILILFSNSLAKIKINLDHKNKSLEVKSKVLQLHAIQLRIINELGHKLVSSTALEDVAELALKAALRLLKVSKASVIIYSGDAMGSYITHIGFERSGFDETGSDIDQKLKSYWNKHLNTISSGHETIACIRGKEPKLKVQSILGVPIESDGEVVGFIAGYSSTARKFNANEIAFLNILAEEVGFAVRNSRLHEGLMKRALMLESLVNVSKTLSSPFRLEKIYKKLAALAATAVNAHRCLVMVSGKQEREVIVVADTVNEYADSQMFEASENSPILEAMQKKKIIMLQGKQDNEINFLCGESEGAALLVPIIFEGHSIGALYFNSPNQMHYSKQDQVLVRAIADQAALLINRAHVYEELKEIAKKSAALAKAGAMLIKNISLESKLEALLEQLKAILNVSEGVVINCDQNTCKIYKTTNSSVGDLACERRDYLKLEKIILNEKQYFISKGSGKAEKKWLDLMQTEKILAIPLDYQNSCMGIAMFFNLGRSALFSNRQISLARLIIDYSAVSIHTARLYSRIEKLKVESEERANNLAALLDVAQTISSSLNTRTVLSRTINVVKRMFNAEAAVLMLHDKFSGELVAKINVGMSFRNIKNFRIKSPNEFLGKVFASRKAAMTVFDDKPDDSFVIQHIEKLKSAAAAPLLARGREIGVISLYSKKANAFTKNDLELLSIFASQVALSLDTASMYEKEHQLAETLQRSLLPTTPLINNIELGVLYNPAHKKSEVGGDYYDFIQLAEGVTGIVIGDVCGKGIDAATETAMARYYLQAFASRYTDPATVLSYVNNTITQKSETQLITMIYMIIDTNNMQVRYANAGHPAALVFSESKLARQLEATGPIVGAIEGATYKSKKINIKKGDFIFMYTDGLIEIHGQTGQILGDERLIQLLGDCCNMSMNQLVRNIFTRAMDWGNNVIRDDVAIVSLKINKQGNNSYGTEKGSANML